MAFVTTSYQPDQLDSPREKISRLLAVAGFIYGLIAALVGATAVAGMLGLAGLVADPGADQAARLLGLPWSLAAGDAQGAASLPITLGALVLNIVILAAAAVLTRVRTRRA